MLVCRNEIVICAKISGLGRILCMLKWTKVELLPMLRESNTLGYNVELDVGKLEAENEDELDDRGH